MLTPIKKEYSKPQLIKIEIDSEISLSLESFPPFGPDEVNHHTFTNDPYKLQNV